MVLPICSVLQLGVQTNSAFPSVLMPMALGLEQDSPAWSHPKQLSMKMSIGLIRVRKDCCASYLGEGKRVKYRGK